MIVAHQLPWSFVVVVVVVVVFIFDIRRCFFSASHKLIVISFSPTDQMEAWRG